MNMPQTTAGLEAYLKMLEGQIAELKRARAKVQATLFDRPDRQSKQALVSPKPARAASAKGGAVKGPE